MLKFFKAVLLLLTFASSNGYAAGGWVKGSVEFVRTHDADYYANTNNWAPPYAWVTLTGVTQAGSCLTWNGRVLFVTSDVQAFALATSALKSGNVLSIAFDDAILKNGFCRALHMTIRGPNAPDIN